MVLSDHSIKEEIKKGRIKITPFIPSCVQPASYDIHLGYQFRVFKNYQAAMIDVKKPNEDLTELVVVKKHGNFIIHPGEFVLAVVLEDLTLPNDLVVSLDGKSSLGRIGLLVHSTAGYVDPGWQGQLTLELSNVSNLPIVLYPEMKIGQLRFMKLSTPAECPYGSPKLKSKYQGAKEPESSKIYKEFKRKKQ